MQSSRVWSLTALAACLGLLIGAWLVRDPQRDGDAIRSALNATLVLRHAENGAFLGSGTLWRRGDVALTNAHVVAGQDRLQVVTRDGERVMARVAARDSDRDIALLHLDTRLDGGLNPGDAPATGDAIFATGAPLQTEFTAT
ncbi:MAG: trypsin-like peptidase domain-containing protein, partial [Pseudooceanicola atlanticus]